MHLKRQAIPKTWPVHRKGTKYVVRPNSNGEHGIPILIVLRDILGVAQNRKEVKRAIFMKNILVDGRPARSENQSILLFDTISLVPMKKFYRLTMGKNGKFRVEEISEKDSMRKIMKITDKKTLKGKKVQLNFLEGRNFISEIKCNTGDSVVMDFSGKKIEKVIPLKAGSRVFVYSGKHTGENGEMINFDKKTKTAEVKFDDKTVRVLTKQLVAIE